MQYLEPEIANPKYTYYKDGTAYVEYADGIRAWLDEDSNCHRNDAPAVTYLDGSYIWLQHGSYHRADGPAVVIKNLEIVEYWYFGNRINVKTDKEFLRFIKLLCMK